MYIPYNSRELKVVACKEEYIVDENALKAIRICFEQQNGGLTFAPINLVAFLSTIRNDEAVVFSLKNPKEEGIFSPLETLELFNQALNHMRNSHNSEEWVSWDSFLSSFEGAEETVLRDALSRKYPRYSTMWKRNAIDRIDTSHQSNKRRRRSYSSDTSYDTYREQLVRDLPPDLRPGSADSFLRADSRVAPGSISKSLQDDQKKTRNAQIEDLSQGMRKIALDGRPGVVVSGKKTGAEWLLRRAAIEAQKEQEERERAAALAEAELLRVQERLLARKRPMTRAQVKRITEACIGRDSEVLVDAFNSEVKRASLRRTRGLDWLNDEVINLYMLLLLERDKLLCSITKNRRASYFFSSYFLTKLVDDGEYCYNNVRRWTSRAKIDVFALDKVIIPTNVGNQHWCLSVIYVQRKTIQYYDSMGGRGTSYMESLLNWLGDEHQDKKKTPLPDRHTWRLVPTQQGTPQQENGCDCGVFTCMFANYLSEDLELDFSQDDMPHFRDLIAWQVLESKAE